MSGCITSLSVCPCNSAVAIQVAKGPESLRLRLATTRSRSAIKLRLDRLLKCVKQGVIVLGCSQ